MQNVEPMSPAAVLALNLGAWSVDTDAGSAAPRPTSTAGSSQAQQGDPSTCNDGPGAGAEGTGLEAGGTEHGSAQGTGVTMARLAIAEAMSPAAVPAVHVAAVEEPLSVRSSCSKVLLYHRCAPVRCPVQTDCVRDPPVSTPCR